MSGKIIIAGTGRAGTSFLVRLLTRLGFDTGFSPDSDGWKADKRGGCEWTAGITVDCAPKVMREIAARWPRILKNPDWSFYLKNFVSAGALNVDHVFIPIREMDEAVSSRTAGS